jgi:hypothetical protein
MVFVARKIRRQKNGAKNKIVCFGEEITGTKVTNPKNILGSRPGENIWFTDDDDNNNNNNNSIQFFIISVLHQQPEG